MFSSNLDRTLDIFKKYLQDKKITSGSIRSYLSDTRYFFNWLTDFLKINNIIQDTSSLQTDERGLKSATTYPCESLVKFITEPVLNAYKNYLKSNNTPVKTINRRFSALRKFGSFCQSKNWLNENVFDTLRTIPENTPFPEFEYHLGEFRASLWKNGAAKSTLKNYFNDTKQFILWSGRNVKWFSRILSGLTQIWLTKLVFLLILINQNSLLKDWFGARIRVYPLLNPRKS